MLGSYEVVGSKIRIKTLYCEDVVKTCRSWAGTYDKSGGYWVVPVTRLSDVQAELGVNLDDQVEIEIGRENWTGYGQLRIGWYVLAGRRSRDYGADVHADLVAGLIPASGGSVKSPAVAASSDARFRLWVPRDFAVARGLLIVTDEQAVDTVDRAALLVERETLVARLAAIDEALSASASV